MNIKSVAEGNVESTTAIYNNTHSLTPRPYPSNTVLCTKMVAILYQATRLIAGISVPNTPLINASISLAQESLPTNGFNHVMRAWLNGQAIINHLPPRNRSVIDTEAFGVATILHDLGW
jgi:hypothetical protein